MTVTRARLDEIAAAYHTSGQVPDKFIEDALQVHSLGWIGRELAPCRTVLELGYGEGIVTEFLVNEGKTVTLLEGSSVLVDKARATWGDLVSCVHGLFEDYEPPGRCDAILASHVLEHVDDPVLLLRRMRRWLNPRGRLIVIVPNSESIHRRLAVRMGLQPRLDTLSPRDHLVGHQRVYSLAGLLADVRAARFVVRRSRGFFFKPLSNAMMLGFSPALIEAMNDLANEMPAAWLANLGLVAQPVSPKARAGARTAGARGGAGTKRKRPKATRRRPA